MNKVDAVKGSPLAVEIDQNTQVVDLGFVLEGGDHIWIEMSRPQLESLSRHIANAIAQLPEKNHRPR